MRVRVYQDDSPAIVLHQQLKARQMRELNLPGTARDYHEDHLVPLCVGGHPSDPRNLWPESVDGQWSARIKDQLESSVCRQVCHGDMTLERGRAIFLAPDWTREYVKYFGPDMLPRRSPFLLISQAFGR